MPPKKKLKAAVEEGEPKSSKSGTSNKQVVRKSVDGSETFILFYGKGTIYSNFCPATFLIDGIQFNCTEQYYHYKKAVHFRDQGTAQKILSSTNPQEQKALGRKVANFNPKAWDAVAPAIMKKGLQAKFEQNDGLKCELLETRGSILVEASPRDRKWGIGLGKHGPKAIDRRQWRGTNLLGEILMQVREELGADAASDTAAAEKASTSHDV